MGIGLSKKIVFFLLSGSLLILGQNCSNSSLDLPELSEAEIEEINTNANPPPPPLEPLLLKTDVSPDGNRFGGNISFSIDGIPESYSQIKWFLNNNEIQNEFGESLIISGLNYLTQGEVRVEIDGRSSDVITLSVLSAMSCKEILDFTPGAASGKYQIDPDGTAANAFGDMEVDCDMTSNGGGWTGITPSIARNDFGGVMAPAVGSNIAQMTGFDLDRPFTILNIMDSDRGHTYHYTFFIPFGYSEFMLTEFAAQPVGDGQNNGDFFPSRFIQSTWNLAFDVNIGDVSFGSPQNAGPTTSFSALIGADTTVTTNSLVSFPRNGSAFRVSPTPVNSFRIGWGEYTRANNSSNGWIPWAQGMVWFR